MKIKSNKEKFLNLINKKNNYKQIILSYKRIYKKKIKNYDISEIKFSTEIEFTPVFEIKKTIKIYYSINIVILSFLIIHDNNKFKVIQKDGSYKVEIENEYEKVTLEINIGVYEDCKNFEMSEIYNITNQAFKEIENVLLENCKQLI